MDSDLTVKNSHSKTVSHPAKQKDAKVALDFTKPINLTGRTIEGGHWGYGFKPDGLLEVCNFEEKTCAIMQDTDKNGKFDKGTLISFDGTSKKDKILSEGKLDENENDVEATARKYLAVLQQQDKEYQPPKINISGKILKFQQQKTGDCGLLAPIGALSFINQGAKIIRKSFSTDYHEGIGVKLQGVDETYFVTPEEIRDSESRLSKGNDAVRALELAVEKRERDKLETSKATADKSQHSELDKRIKAPLNYGFYKKEAFQLLTKCRTDSVSSYNYTKVDYPQDSDFSYRLIPRDPFKDPSLVKVAREQNTKAKRILDAKEKYPDRFAVTVSFIIPEYALNDNAPYDDSGKGLPHAVIVKKVKRNSIILVNPWDTSKEIKLPRKGFSKEFVEIVACDLKTRRNTEEDNL